MSTNPTGKLARYIITEVLPHLDWMMPKFSNLLVRRWLSTPGTYVVKLLDSHVELLDSRGKTVRYTKHQHVRFMRDNVIAYQDMVWGDGDIFADYQCVPGVAVDRYKEGHRWHVLISLRQTKNRGDTEQLHITRTIKNSFTQDDEDFQTEINHRTNHLRLRLTFPKSRPPKRVRVVAQNRSRTITLAENAIQQLADGRFRVTWETSARSTLSVGN